MRTCPFKGCGRTLPDTIFACRTHWFMMSKADQAMIWSLYRQYQADKIGIGELIDGQNEVMENYGGTAK